MAFARHNHPKVFDQHVSQLDTRQSQAIQLCFSSRKIQKSITIVLRRKQAAGKTKSHYMFSVPRNNRNFHRRNSLWKHDQRSSRAAISTAQCRECAHNYSTLFLSSFRPMTERWRWPFDRPLQRGAKYAWKAIKRKQQQREMAKQLATDRVTVENK